MSFETLNCNECGALIQVPTIARYVTCNQCGAHLIVQRTGAAAYTEATHQPAPPDPPDPARREMSERLEHLESQNELYRLDSEWQTGREQYMITSRYGGRYVPSAFAAVVIGILGVGFGLFWIVMGLGMADNFAGSGMALYMPLFGLVFIVAGIVVSFYQFYMAQRYQAAYATYQRRRAKILDDSHRMKE
jgi:hypothetical protein